MRLVADSRLSVSRFLLPNSSTHRWLGAACLSFYKCLTAKLHVEAIDGCLSRHDYGMEQENGGQENGGQHFPVLHFPVPFKLASPGYGFRTSRFDDRQNTYIEIEAAVGVLQVESPSILSD